MTAAILGICAVITVGVFSVMLYSVATFEHKSQPSQTPQPHRLAIEIVWFSIPILIFIGALVPVVAALPAVD